MNRGLQAALAAVLLSGAATVNAADGFYLGAGFGVATVKDELNTGKLDADDAAVKGFFGYRNALRVVDLALEAAYTDFGKPSQIVGAQNVQFKLSGASLAGLLIAPLGPVDLFGKMGVMAWNSELKNGAAVSNRSGADLFYGTGIGFNLGKIGLRAEWERFQIKSVDRVDLLSVSALFQF